MADSLVSSSPSAFPWATVRAASRLVATAIEQGFRSVVVVATHSCQVHASPDQVARELLQFISTVERKCNFTPEYVYCDGDEAVVYSTIKKMIEQEELSVTVRRTAKTSEKDRINLTSRLISEGRFFMSTDCSNLSSALLEAKWSDSARERQAARGRHCRYCAHKGV